MKPIKFKTIPPDPCESCLVKITCNKICDEKIPHIEWVNTRYTSNYDGRYYKKRKGSDLLRKLYFINMELIEKNRKRVLYENRKVRLLKVQIRVV